MSTEPSTVPVHRVDPPRFATEQRRLFIGMHLRIGTSPTVHGVTWRPWINGLTLSAPACRQGWSGLGGAGELLPTHQAAPCRKCQPILGVNALDRTQAAVFELPNQPDGLARSPRFCRSPGLPFFQRRGGAEHARREPP